MVNKRLKEKSLENSIKPSNENPIWKPKFDDSSIFNEFGKNARKYEQGIYHAYLDYAQRNVEDREKEDPTGSKGHAIASCAYEISINHGFENVKQWIDFMENQEKKRTRFLENLSLMEDTYSKIKKLGRTLREVNQAIEEIEIFEKTAYGDNSSGIYFLRPYNEKVKIVSAFKKSYEPYKKKMQ